MLATTRSPLLHLAPTLSALQIGAGWFPEFCAGGENVYYHLSKHLPATGVSVCGLVVGSGNVARQSGGTVRSFASRSTPLARRLWLARKAVTEALALDPPDIVVAHFALFALPALDKIRARPFIVHFHGPWAAESRIGGAGLISAQMKKAVERLVYRRANRLIALSEAFAKILVRDYGVEASRIVVIPGGVDCARFAIAASRADARERLGWDRHSPSILTVRRLARRMGLQELVRSMVEVQRRVPGVQLLIAGRGDQEEVLRRLIRELDLSRTVRLLGFVPDELLPWAYRAADLSVMPSTELEGFGLPTAESLAAGTPVLVTPVGGLPEAVRALGTQLVLPGHTPAEIAAGLADALQGKLLLPSAAQSQAFARRRFDWPVIAARTREVYCGAIR